MEKTLKLDIVSAEEPIYSENVKMLVISGELGELGVMPNHTPLLTKIKPGHIRVNTLENEEKLFYVSGGLLEIQPYVTTVLADTIIRAEDLDEDAATAARERAEQALSGKEEKISREEAISQLNEAIAKLRVIRELRDLTKR
ncbi:MAG: F0F1 ATP synthase subunit epsilon [Gammaproteobacteria bacterium]